MRLPHAFSTFLAAIRPTESQRADAKTGHETLRERLTGYDGLKEIIVLALEEETLVYQA